jgi:hypothetical protein
MIQETWMGWAIVFTAPDGTEKITVWDQHSSKEESHHAEDMLKSERETSPDISFRLINIKIDITEVEP